MKDKDLLVVIAEMLRKQDQQTEILTNLMDVSLKQFEQQHQFNIEQHKFNLEQHKFNQQQQAFNEKFLEVNEKIVDRLERIEKKL